MPGFFKRLVPLLALASACFAIHGQASAASPAPVLSGCSRPAYPSASIAARETGTVTLSLNIDATGKVLAVNIFQSSGHPALDAAARDSIAKCSFTQKLDKGKPVSYNFKMKYVWSLDDTYNGGGELPPNA